MENTQEVIDGDKYVFSHHNFSLLVVQENGSQRELDANRRVEPKSYPELPGQLPTTALMAYASAISNQ